MAVADLEKITEFKEFSSNREITRKQVFFIQGKFQDFFNDVLIKNDVQLNCGLKYVHQYMHLDGSEGEVRGKNLILLN